MNTDLRIRSPFASVSRTAASSPRATTESASAPSDGYAGTIGAPPAAVPETRGTARSLAQRLAVVALGALALVGVAGVVTAQAAPPTPEMSQTVGVHYSNPGRAVPDNAAQVDDTAWQSTFGDAFKAVKGNDPDAFLRTLSADGVWVRGLPEAPKTATGMLYMTHDEVARDLHDHGPLFNHVFAAHDNARMVVSPDGQAHVQTILLD
jgi:hypothetical protein